MSWDVDICNHKLCLQFRKWPGDLKEGICLYSHFSMMSFEQLWVIARYKCTCILGRFQLHAFSLTDISAWQWGRKYSVHSLFFIPHPSLHDVSVVCYDHTPLSPGQRITLGPCASNALRRLPTSGGPVWTWRLITLPLWEGLLIRPSLPLVGDAHL